MALPEPPPTPQAVDYSGLPLTEGDTVAFLTTDPLGLARGQVRIIGPNDLCIDTGHNLVVFPATRPGLRLPWPKPLGGTAKPHPIPDGAQQYPQVALQPAPPDEAHESSAVIGDAVRAGIGRHFDYLRKHGGDA
jgi:hypothetical protein